MNKLQQIINGRAVCLLAHGKSIENLESYIEKVDSPNICWMGLGLFPLFEKHILSKVNRKLDIVFDCATVPHARLDHYEPIRLGRVHEFLNRPQDNVWLTTHGLIRDSVKPYMPILIEEWYKDKIFQIDSLFPSSEIQKWMDVPNSMTLAIGAALAGGASKVFIFGMDGYTGDLSKGLDSYYCKEEHRKERMSALGRLEDPGINRDTGGFEGRFPKILKNYRALFGNLAPVYNVSPVSVYTVLPKIQYEQLEECINGQNVHNSRSGD